MLAPVRLEIKQVLARLGSEMGGAAASGCGATEVPGKAAGWASL